MNVIRVISAVVALAVSLALSAQETLREVSVFARRPIKDIGVEKTVIDSAALKENLALSMADILAFNSSIFVKNHGRATLSTVAFRGTAAGHTQVTWNGMRINNPMIGSTDFSTIPSYFVDQAAIIPGTSSVGETGGGLGGLVRLGTLPQIDPGFSVRYIQGIGSFSTFDEFLRLTYGSSRWRSSTRVSFSSSENDYPYTNHDKKVNIYDDDNNVIGQRHPRERNRSGSFRDLHILQEVYYAASSRDRLSLSAWYVNSNREIPLLTTDYGEETEFENRQREQTVRAVLAWNRYEADWKTSVSAGYSHSHTAYDYKRQPAPGLPMAQLTRSRSDVNTFYARAEGDWSLNRKWFFTANIAAYQHLVRSVDRNIVLTDGNNAIIGYDKGRAELSGAISAKWQPVDRLGLSLVLREEMFGKQWAPLIPAFFIDGVISRKGNLTARASVSRNHRFPSLNDMYFMPGGNPDLRNESGFTYDAGLSFSIGGPKAWSIGGSATWFESYIDDWIIWLPTTKGFFTPRNLNKVHSYGVELRMNAVWQPARQWLLDISSSYSWTPSVNKGPAMSDADRSVGKQLPYVPRHSASLTGRLSWRSWSLLYKWNWYSRRFTMTDNDNTISGSLPVYFMNNVSLEKSLSFRPLDVNLKLAVNNLFNEDYISVLSRPMPGINFEFFISLTPKFRKRNETETSY